ncbi:unnamed protein product, partial [Mesorhabditis belari]|uniref:EF-hand domain-containing protein n=1 Tax=Mesorhabditis belari TaxID=2138241 RepID=A0AAF3ENV1_9BILA
MSELKEVFAQHDKNGDGTISGDDLGQILRAIGYHLTKVEQEEFPEKTIDFSKFLHIMAQKENESKKGTHLRQIFRILDKDENGYIGKEELRQVMAVHGEAIDDVDSSARTSMDLSTISTIPFGQSFSIWD